MGIDTEQKGRMAPNHEAEREGALTAKYAKYAKWKIQYDKVLEIGQDVVKKPKLFRKVAPRSSWLLLSTANKNLLS
jgi:hypothetical protein